MIPKSLCRWLAKRARKNQLAERFEQNYLQLTRYSEEEYDSAIFVQNLQQRLRLLITLNSIPPQHWSRYLSLQAREESESWAEEISLFSRRTIIPVMRWNGLPLVLAHLMKVAPAGFEFLLMTRDPVYQRLTALQHRTGNSLLSSRPLMVFLCIDERLPESPLVPLLFNGNRLLITAVMEKVLKRLRIEIQTLLPSGMPCDSNFHLAGNIYPVNGWSDALQANLDHLLHVPAEWVQWDDISVLLHG